MNNSSAPWPGGDQKRSTGTPSISPWIDRNSDVFALVPSSRHTRADRSSVSTANVSHLHSTVVLPQPAGPTNTWGRGVEPSLNGGGTFQKLSNAALTCVHSSSSDDGAAV